MGDIAMFCSKCGSQNDDNAKFCKSCGAKIDIKENSEDAHESEAMPTPTSEIVMDDNSSPVNTNAKARKSIPGFIAGYLAWSQDLDKLLGKSSAEEKTVPNVYAWGIIGITVLASIVCYFIPDYSLLAIIVLLVGNLTLGFKDTKTITKETGVKFGWADFLAIVLIQPLYFALRTYRLKAKWHLFIVSLLVCGVSFFTIVDPPDLSPKWNTSELDISKNGNVAIAIKTIQKNPNYVSLCQNVNLEDVYKTPWNYYGKPISITGIIGLIEDYPPGHEITKMLGSQEASEIVILKDDFSTGVYADMYLMKSSGNLAQGQRVTLHGYAVGKMEGTNQLGGKVTNLVLVGNAYSEP
jgi:hypothetical protein